MSARLSVIVRAQDAEQALPGCAAALFEGVQVGLLKELIVVDGGSTDATCRIAEEIGAEVIVADGDAAAQLAAGAAVARGEWLLLLVADVQLASGWTQAVATQIASGRAGAFRLVSRRRGPGARLGAAAGNLRLRLLGRPGPDHVLLRPALAGEGAAQRPVLMRAVARR